MSEVQAGAFTYTIHRHQFRSGRTSWSWQVRHTASGGLVDAGISLHSHDEAKTAVFDAMSAVGGKPPGGAPSA